MNKKTKQELVEDAKFQHMKRYLGIRHVRNYCSGCGEQIQEPVYCDDCHRAIATLGEKDFI